MIRINKSLPNWPNFREAIFSTNFLRTRAKINFEMCQNVHSLKNYEILRAKLENKCATHLKRKLQNCTEEVWINEKAYHYPHQQDSMLLNIQLMAKFMCKVSVILIKFKMTLHEILRHILKVVWERKYLRTFDKFWGKNLTLYQCQNVPWTCSNCGIVVDILLPI